MKVKIHCFEGEWDPNHRDLSVRPMLSALESSYHAVGSNLLYSYHFCQSVKRLQNELEALDGRSFPKNLRHCFYFAFHGRATGLNDCEGGFITFEEIAKSLDKIAEGSIIFFGSCGTKASEPQLKSFQQLTKARLVIGYSKSVDWLTSSTFEILFFNELHERISVGAFVKRIREVVSPRACYELMTNLGVWLTPAM